MHGLNEQDSKAEAPLISQKGKRVKDLIKEKIFTLILESNGISQKQIHHSFRIRPVDLSLAIKELEADGLILRSSVQEKRVRGRPEVFFVADSRRIVSFALYVESWNIYGVVLDMHGNEIYGCRQAIAGDASRKPCFAPSSTLFPSCARQPRKRRKLPALGLACREMWIRGTASGESASVGPACAIWTMPISAEKPRCRGYLQRFGRAAHV